MERSKAGKWGWAAIGVFVAAWDMLATETLTSAFRRGAENPKTAPLVLGALAITAAHLTDMIPEKYDPFYGSPAALDWIADKVHLDIILDNLTD